MMQKLCPGWSFISNHNTHDDGRVIVIWKSPTTVQLIQETWQSIICKVDMGNGDSFYLSAVYASNTREERLDLWSSLREVQQTYYLENHNWIIGDDLNQIAHYSEHSLPAVDHLTSDMLELRDVFNDLGVDDLRYHGTSHTWTNKRPADPITKKLDRALVNIPWIQSYPNSLASFLPIEFSDHSPCLLSLNCPLPQSGTKPFKFFNFLTLHPQFLQTVETAWILGGGEARDLATLGYKLKNLKRSLKTLHKDNFSDIQKRVSEANVCLKTVQVQAMNDPNTENFQHERECHQRWSYLRGIEESFYHQKSRVNWLRVGDNNSPFFQMIAAARNSCNSIRVLTTDDGRDITDPDIMSNIAITHFKGILAPDHLPQLTCTLQWLQQLNTFRCNRQQQHLMSTAPTEAEIHLVLSKLNPNKSPGPDGFTSGFFKAAWLILGAEFLIAVSQFFTTGFLPTATNATILTLVPKKPGASQITDFRPISCCNTSYKVISRLLVRRIKPILTLLILPNQTTFIKGRLLLENTILASEIVQGYHRKGGGEENYTQTGYS